MLGILTRPARDIEMHVFKIGCDLSISTGQTSNDRRVRSPNQFSCWCVLYLPLGLPSFIAWKYNIYAFKARPRVSPNPQVPEQQLARPTMARTHLTDSRMARWCLTYGTYFPGNRTTSRVVTILYSN